MKFSSSSLLTLALMTAALLLTGCGIPSVHPLYEPKDLIMDESLTGLWESGDTRYMVQSISQLQDSVDKYTSDPDYDRTTVDVAGLSVDHDALEEFRGFGLANAYLVWNPEEEEPENVFLAGLLRVGSHDYMDFYQFETGETTLAFPVHVFRQAEIRGDTLVLRDFDEDFLKELISNRQLRIKHEVSMDNFLLTASPAELQKFVLKYAGDERALSNRTNTYTRVQ
ncbi:MAG: hypothetical protein U5K31_15055 [Balneolaceae bacterium]|nr:hypothetical protein [Balneolaceae bacterium]